MRWVMRTPQTNPPQLSPRRKDVFLGVHNIQNKPNAWVTCLPASLRSPNRRVSRSGRNLLAVATNTEKSASFAISRSCRMSWIRAGDQPGASAGLEVCP